MGNESHKFLTSDDLIAIKRSNKQVPDAPLIRAGLHPLIKGVNEAARSIDFCISDASLDRDNDTINVAGWDLENYLKNPVVLWAHDPHSPPVARAPDTRINANELISTAIFMNKDMGPPGEFADAIFRMYVGGFMRATSVGFRPTDYEMHSDHGESGEWGIEFRAQELLEYSCVPVPANPNALMRAKAAGIDTSPFVKWAEKLLEGGGHVYIPKKELEALRTAAGGKLKTYVTAAQQDELRRKNLMRVTLPSLFPNAKAGDFFVVGADRTVKWGVDAAGQWNSAPVGGNEVIAADGRVTLKGASTMANVRREDGGEGEGNGNGGDKPTLKPLYVKRPVLNHKEIHRYMKEQGFHRAVHGDHMHVSIFHAKDPVDHEAMPHHDEAIKIQVHRGTPVWHQDAAHSGRGVHTMSLEEEGAHQLKEDHNAYSEAGAIHNEEAFHPHCSLSYHQHPEHGDHTLDAFSGEMHLGPEQHHEHKSPDPAKGEIIPHVNLDEWDGESNDLPMCDEEENADAFGPSQADQHSQDGGNPPKSILDALAAGHSVRRNHDGSWVIESIKKDAEWHCKASRDFPVKEGTWDGAAAKASIFNACGFDGDNPDTARAARHFLACDGANPKLKGSYKLPFARIDDGKSVVISNGIHNCASRLAGTQIPEEVKTKAQAVIDHYKGKLDDGKSGLSEDEVKRMIAEAIAKDREQRGQSDDGLTIKTDDGKVLSSAEEISSFITRSVDSAIKRHKGNVDAFNA